MTKHSFTIATHKVGYGRPVFIIAEAGVNHNGSLPLALKLVDAAAKAGADAIKFQTFHAEDVVIPSGKMADYQRKNIGKTESQLAMLKKLELQARFYAPIIQRCKQKKIVFLSTPHGGFTSVDELKAKVPAFKFGSGDLTNLPVLAYAAKFKKPLILGTGMATLSEVREAIAAIRQTGNRDIAMLHCTSNYPCPFEEVNLRAMQKMMRDLDVLVGYSDHTSGIQVPIMAATLGACIIEKHFTLDRTLPGPDHQASLEPTELKEMVVAIRRVPVIFGTADKQPGQSEKKLRNEVRKSLVTLQVIRSGEKLTKSNIGIKRPGTGLAPKEFERVLGKRARRDLPADILLSRYDLA